MKYLVWLYFFLFTSHNLRLSERSHKWLANERQKNCYIAIKFHLTHRTLTLHSRRSTLNQYIYRNEAIDWFLNRMYALKIDLFKLVAGWFMACLLYGVQCCWCHWKGHCIRHHVKQSELIGCVATFTYRRSVKKYNMMKWNFRSVQNCKMCTEQLPRV